MGVHCAGLVPQGAEVDGTALQHSRLAGVSLGRPHQHADPAERKGEGVSGGSLTLLQSPQAGRAGWGGIDAPRSCIYISEDATDARGTGWSQAVPHVPAVTNTVLTPPPLTLSFPTFPCH